MDTATAAIFIGVLTAALMPLRWWTRRRAGTLDWRHEGLVIGALTLMLVGLAAVGATGAIAQQVVLPLVGSSIGLAMVHHAARSP